MWSSPMRIDSSSCQNCPEHILFIIFLRSVINVTVPLTELIRVMTGQHQHYQAKSLLASQGDLIAMVYYYWSAN